MQLILNCVDDTENLCWNHHVFYGYHSVFSLNLALRITENNYIDSEITDLAKIPNHIENSKLWTHDANIIYMHANINSNKAVYP